MKEKWDERYSAVGFAYGEEPNNFLKEELIKIPVGTILFPAEGEGRNAVYAARTGWKASAFDLSAEGRKKAMQLAGKHGVSIEYAVGEPEHMRYTTDQFDAIALIYAHFPAGMKSAYHKKLATFLRPGGTVIFEAFSKNHLEYMRNNPQMGGPKEVETLFSTEEIRSDFENFEIIELREQEIELNEGNFHIGKGSVIRFVGRKK
jgi:cyclopropane fatty-acyl-phospholipid synthase-like methyltransferase